MNPPLFDDILAQPAAMDAVSQHQFGPGLDALVRAADLLRRSKRIVLTGMGASLFGCIPLGYMLGRRGVNVSVVEAAELLHFLSATLDENTAVLLVSRSGESIEILKLLDVLKERGCQSIGVANVPGSTLATKSTENILLNSPPDELVAIQTYSATVVALALLGAAYLGELDEARRELEIVSAALGKWISECWTASETCLDFVKPGPPVYILGRGSGMASVHEGVLLMHETAKSPAVGMSVAQFRHGPVEATDEHFRAIVIGTQQATEAIDLRFAEDIQRMGGRVRWLGPLREVSPVASLCPWPRGVPERFCSVFETVPFQVLAYRAAEAKGLRPGQFRWASTVTSSESGFPGLDVEGK